MMNVFKEAREILRTSPDAERNAVLRAAVDECKNSYDWFIASATTEAMQDLVGKWTRLVIAIKGMGPLGGDNNVGGRVPVPQQALAA